MSQAVAIEPLTELTSPEMPDSLFEVVRGQVVERPPMAFESGWIASRLQILLGQHALSRRAGTAVVEVLFVLGGDLQRRPDLAFVSAERWPLDRKIRRGPEGWDVVPNLAVEVNSPNNKLADVLTKIREYFEAGVEQVWLIIPSERLIYVYDAPDRVRILTQDQELDGGAILADFRIPVAELFPDIAGDED